MVIEGLDGKWAPRRELLTLSRSHPKTLVEVTRQGFSYPTGVQNETKHRPRR